METRNLTRLDAQEQLIQKLKADVLEMKSTLQSLEADRAENVEFRQVMLAWMKKQEKQKFEGSSGSGVLGGHTFNGECTWDGEDRPTGLPWAMKKVQLPEFSGFDTQGWIQKANLYFDINHTPDELRIRLAQLSMVGVAQHWFTIITQVRESFSWVDFQAELLQRFSGLEIHNPYEQLATLKRDSIHDFIDDFEYLLSLVPRLPESQALGYFIAGLKDDVKQWVRLHRPLSRLDAMYLAKDVEAMLRPNSSANNLSQSRFRYLQSPGHAFQKERGVRSLSRTEWEERRKKGLCFRCGQAYGPAHKCPKGKLRVLLLGDDDDGGADVELLRLEQLDCKEEPPVDVTVLGIHITLGDGCSIFVTEQCLKIPVSIGSFQFLLDVLVFDMGNLDLILGMAWLASLGEVVHNWHHSWMQFQFDGKEVRLQGVSHNQSKSVALQQWLGHFDCCDSELAVPSVGDSTLSDLQQQVLSRLLHDVYDVFAAPMGLPPSRSHDHSIQLHSDTPICVRPYRYPHIQKAEIERQVSELLSLGMIRPSKSAYSSPVILVRKKDNTWRMCVDYRALNAATIPDKYPIPIVEELLDELHESFPHCFCFGVFN
ncbi:hypothetical protein E3N88_14911 [Mikania micrantha]|uniref:Ty3 transposon capsid-like protein domain-containing protein n=1 Tax=Mikania micrantha TaxID=192012 RepID=A0A5N6P4I3_9ASTR|nr:hypothetical protein E3N88_14911 [Mikania micrantha]